MCTRVVCGLNCIIHDDDDFVEFAREFCARERDCALCGYLAMYAHTTFDLARRRPVGREQFVVMPQSTRCAMVVQRAAVAFFVWSMVSTHE